MTIAKISALILVATMAFASTANAQFLTGSLSFSGPGNNGVGGGGDATSSSLQFFPSNVVESTTGNFVNVVPLGGDLLAYRGTISGLSTSPLSDSINNYFTFSVRNFYPPGGPGTTPPNRFDFDLQTITENSYDSGDGAALFTGTGTIVDTSGEYQNTPGEFTVTFSGPQSYTFTVNAVPEPTTISLIGAGLLGALVLRRTKIHRPGSSSILSSLFSRIT